MKQLGMLIIAIVVIVHWIWTIIIGFSMSTLLGLVALCLPVINAIIFSIMLWNVNNSYCYFSILTLVLVFIFMKLDK